MAHKQRTEKAADIPAWSWLAAAVGLTLVVGSAGFMIYRGLTHDVTPPHIVVDRESVSRSGNAYLVEIRVVNLGGSAAAGLQVEGVLQDGSETVETSTLTIDYVPSNSHRRAGLFFKEDPGKFELQLRAMGYQQP